MSDKENQLQAVIARYRDNQSFNQKPPFNVVLVPESTYNYVLQDLRADLDVLLNYEELRKFGNKAVENLVALNTVKQFSALAFGDEGLVFDLDDNLNKVNLLPLLFEAYNIHAHWMVNNECPDIEMELAKYIPLKEDLDNPNGTTTYPVYRFELNSKLDCCYSGIQHACYLSSPIYDKVTMSKCGKYVFVSVPMSDYTPPDDGASAVKIYLKKLMKSVLLKATTHHPETQVSNSSFFASYLTSLSHQN